MKRAASRACWSGRTVSMSFVMTSETFIAASYSVEPE
jgi:hypothetical protein